MAVFSWSYASWDKTRPKLLPSTGLGEEQGLKDTQEISVNIRPEMPKEELKFIDGCGNGESSFEPGQGYANAAKIAQAIVIKKSILKADPPPTVMPKWDKVFQAVALLNENRQTYRQHPHNLAS